MWTRRGVLVAGLSWCGGATAQTHLAGAAAAVATPPEVAAEVPGARLLGAGRMRYLGLRVYDARLWAAAAPAALDWAAAALALELEYARSLDGTLIADRSLSEMLRQGEIEPAKARRWLLAMQQIFPDVQAGDRITGVNVPDAGARFLVNGRHRGDVREPEFARLFLGIWLSPRTSEPTLRDALLGKAT